MGPVTQNGRNRRNLLSTIDKFSKKREKISPGARDCRFSMVSTSYINAAPTHFCTNHVMDYFHFSFIPYAKTNYSFRYKCPGNMIEFYVLSAFKAQNQDITWVLEFTLCEEGGLENNEQVSFFSYFEWFVYLTVIQKKIIKIMRVYMYHLTAYSKKSLWWLFSLFVRDTWWLTEADPCKKNTQGLQKCSLSKNALNKTIKCRKF